MMMTFVGTELARRGVRIIRQGLAGAGELKRVGHELIGPCPRCGGRDRFAVNTAKDIWNCRGCRKGGDAIDLVQHLDGVGFAEAVEVLTGEKPQPAAKITAKTKIDRGDGERERRQHDKARWLWSRRQPMAGSIAERYLREARGITVATPITLGFLPPSKPDHHPAMIAAFGIPDEPEPGVLGEPREVSAIHLTLLKPDGSGKADVEKPKIIIASPAGMPVVLAPLSDSVGLVITEGIEDALSVHAATGLGAWAAGSAGFMPKLAAAIVRASPEVVTIWAHADAAGQDGAHKLAARLDARGIEVFVEGMS
jgi:putative DNA primase/helicase